MSSSARAPLLPRTSQRGFAATEGASAKHAKRRQRFGNSVIDNQPSILVLASFGVFGGSFLYRRMGGKMAASEKSSQNATNLAYSSPDFADHEQNAAIPDSECADTFAIRRLVPWRALKAVPQSWDRRLPKAMPKALDLCSPRQRLAQRPAFATPEPSTPPKRLRRLDWRRREPLRHLPLATCHAAGFRYTASPRCSPQASLAGFACRFSPRARSRLIIRLRRALLGARKNFAAIFPEKYMRAVFA